MNEVLTDLKLDATSLVSEVKLHYVKKSDGSEFLAVTSFDSTVPIAIFDLGFEGDAPVRTALDFSDDTPPSLVGV